MANSYKDVFKGTAIFGGTQIIQVLVGLIRAKLVSVLIGPKGMGVNSLYTSSLLFVQTFSGLGLKDSSVRSIAVASTGDPKLLARRLSVINRCFYFSYALGVLVTLLLSPILSQLSFKCLDYTINYGFLSLYILFQLQYQYYIAILQGFRKLKKLALVSVINSIVGVLLSGVLYYCWGIEGIVANLILTSFVCMLCVRIPVARMKLPSVKLTFKESFVEGREMIYMGIVLTISVLIGTGVNYSINSIISHFGSVEDIGYYQAALNITTQSISLIFAAMTADYYPRLAQVCHNRDEMVLTVNRQAEVLLNLGIPILATMIVFSGVVIKILLTNEFMVIDMVIKLLCLGSLIQIFSYPIGNISFAKGDKKFFFTFEAIIGSSLRLVLYSIGYILGGLLGLALSVIATNITYLLIVLIATKQKYDYVVSRDMICYIVITLPIFIILILLSNLCNAWISYSLQSLVLLLLVIYHIWTLENKVGVIKFLLSKIK